MKTKIALAASAKNALTAAEKKQIKDVFSAIFGTQPQKAKFKREGTDEEYDWNKSAGQLYFQSNGKIEMFIHTSGLPTMEFSARNFDAAIKKLGGFVRSVQKSLDAQMKQIENKKKAVDRIAAALK